MFERLQRAVAAGIISDDQARALSEFLAADTPPMPVISAPDPDDEQVRLVGGFNDIFVTIGIGLLMGAYILFNGLNFQSPLAMSVVVVSSWGLAELFTRRQRLSLTSNLLSMVFGGAVIALNIGALAKGMDVYPSKLSAASITFCWLLGGAAIFLHYLRFRVPINIAMVVGCILAALLALFFRQYGWAYRQLPIFLAGVAAFAIGMVFDSRDPLRRTARTDIAFWLHLMAAPMIVHSAFQGLFFDSRGDVQSASGILILFAVLAFVAIVIDRRAMLVSGLAYAGYAIYNVARQTQNGMESSEMTAMALLMLGIGVVLLGFGWRPVRRLFLSLLPVPVRRYLPPADQVSK